MKTLNDSLGNPVWVAEHIKELREIFPAEYRPVSVAFLMHFGAAVHALGVEIPEDVTINFESLLVSLRDCGVCEARTNRITGQVMMKRGKVQSFELEAANNTVDKVLSTELTPEASEQIRGILERLKYRPSDF